LKYSLRQARPILLAKYWYSLLRARNHARAQIFSGLNECSINGVLPVIDLADLGIPPAPRLLKTLDKTN